MKILRNDGSLAYTACSSEYARFNADDITVPQNVRQWSADRVIRV